MASAGNYDRKASGCTGDTMSTEYVTREELEAALLQVHAELAEDRKRITMIEEFARELFSVLWVKLRGARFDLDEKVRKYVPYFYSKSEKSSMDEFSVET